MANPDIQTMINAGLERHKANVILRAAGYAGRCDTCNGPWPCDAAKALRGFRVLARAIDKFAQGECLAHGTVDCMTCCKATRALAQAAKEME